MENEQIKYFWVKCTECGKKFAAPIPVQILADTIESNEPTIFDRFCTECEHKNSIPADELKIQLSKDELKTWKTVQNHKNKNLFKAHFEGEEPK